MKESEILEFREKAISYFLPILVAEGYSQQQSEELAFYTTKILEDALPLIKNIEENNSDVEKITQNIHLLFCNLHSFVEGKKVLMWET